MLNDLELSGMGGIAVRRRLTEDRGTGARLRMDGGAEEAQKRESGEKIEAPGHR